MEMFGDPAGIRQQAALVRTTADSVEALITRLDPQRFGITVVPGARVVQLFRRARGGPEHDRLRRDEHCINAQDRAVQESMGVIVDRSREHLGPADRAIIAARRLLSE